MTHPPEVGGVGLERGGDGAFECDGAVGVKQLDEPAGEDTEVVVTLGGGGEQGLGRWGGVVETVGGAVLAGGALVALERFDVCGVFDLLGAVERAPMGGEHGGGVEDAHGLERGRDGEGAADVVVGDGIIVPIEPYVGALGGGDLDALLAGERIVGKRDEVGALLRRCTSATVRCGSSGQGRSAARLWHHSSAWTLRSSRSRKRRAWKKTSANKADEPLHPTLLISSRRCDRAWLEAVVGGEFEQRGMEPNGIATTLEHDAFHIVVEQDLRRAPSMENASTWPRMRLASEAPR